MGEEKMKTIEISAEQIKSANDLLFERWVEVELLPKMAKENHNQGAFNQILTVAQQTGETIPIICVGCQPMEDVAGIDGKPVSVVSAFDLRESSRAVRWAKGFAIFQKALLSFGIKTHLNFSLSDMELMAQIIDKPQNSEMIDIERIKNNIQIIQTIIERNGGNSTAFIHSELLGRASGAKDIRELVSIMLPNWKGEFLTHTIEGDGVEPLPTALYDADPMLLPSQLLNREQEEMLVWLDMMSDLATEDHKLLLESIHRNRPGTALIAPVKNGGNWSSAGEPIIQFQSRIEFISRQLGLEFNEFVSTEDWLEKVKSCVHEDDLHRLLNFCGISNLEKSTSGREKAIRILEAIAFGSNTFQLNSIKQIEFKGERIKNLLAGVTGTNSGHIFNLMKTGNVRVNDVVISDINFVPNIGDVVMVGKKVRVQIV
jgi:hypothetical protein